jgi:hypothetical protein
MSAILLPGKTDAELVINTDAVLASSVPGERLQSIARRHPQVRQADGSFHLVQLPKRHVLDVPPASIVPLDEEIEGVGILEVLNHVTSEYNATCYM